MAMADTLFFNGRQDKYPYHTNYPPTVPRYPSSQEMFRYDRYFTPNPPPPSPPSESDGTYVNVLKYFILSLLLNGIYEYGYIERAHSRPLAPPDVTFEI